MRLGYHILIEPSYVDSLVTITNGHKAALQMRPVATQVNAPQEIHSLRSSWGIVGASDSTNRVLEAYTLSCECGLHDVDKGRCGPLTLQRFFPDFMS